MKFRLTPNRIIKYLILSEFTFWTGWGLLTPVFAIFIVDKIQGGDAFVAGMAAAIFWIVRSLLRIPFGILVDTLPSEKDDYFVLVIGLFIASLVPFGFIFASTPLHIYVLQGVYGLAMALSYSGRMPIFIRHIDKSRESTDWGLNAASTGLGMGLAGAIGGWAVTRFGFTPVFVWVGILGLIGVALLFGLKNQIKGVFDRESLDGGVGHLKDIFNGRQEHQEHNESQ